MPTKNEATKLSLKKIDHTCPEVEDIFKDLKEKMQNEFEIEFDKILSKDLLYKIEGIIKDRISEAEHLIKKNVTYKFRESLDESCLEQLELNEEILNLKYEISDLEDTIKELEEVSKKESKAA